MKRKIALGIMLMLFLIGTLSMNVNETRSDLVEEWIPYVPSSQMVDLEFWMLNETSYINITITFPDSGYMVSDWGTVTKDGGEIGVDSEIWDWTGISLQVITTLSHTYDLGQLDGYYTFTFKAWGIDVKSVSFKASTAQMLLETDKDTYFLGENVAIILKNIGNETEIIGGYPAWMIYAYPEEERVYPKIFAFLLWELAPGENDTIIWNQYNAFTNSPAYPGMYVVRDKQGWGLSAYFTILPGNLPPIADFIYSPTFPYVGQTVTFDASGSSDIDGTIVSYVWDFGDGLIGTDVITTHTYESAGTFTVTLTVTDDLGATDTLQQEITVDPLPTLTITINKIKKGTTETILLELVDDDYDGFITQDINNRILSIIKRTHKTTTFDFPGEYTATKGALKVILQSGNDFTITLT